VSATDTIFACATPPGVGGIGVTRLSGPRALQIAHAVTQLELRARHAHFCAFLDAGGEALDSGIALYFPAPNSFTGEDVVELQGHGGPVVQQLLARRLASLGARMARPGEFSERAFLNNRLDLAQAEAIADLVCAGTDAAARAAQRSLEGALSQRVAALQEQLTALRVFVEAALDFPEEEIDFIAESDVLERLAALARATADLVREAHQGQVLRDGVTVAIVGQPNVGKSSLLNALSGRDAAIVTDIPGTTRDVLRETISLGGLPVHVADTAGIRETGDLVEAEGVRRARQAMATADLVLLVIDVTQPAAPQLALQAEAPVGVRVLRVLNKIDLAGLSPGSDPDADEVRISAHSGDGLDALVSLVRDAAGISAVSGGAFSARTRHLDALRRVEEHLREGEQQLRDFNSGETLAEELRLAQNALGEITGTVLPDDLLGAIFTSFCIGK
jgi:tRNA modification GTPase